jgi:hypothetical protein
LNVEIIKQMDRLFCDLCNKTDCVIINKNVSKLSNSIKSVSFNVGFCKDCIELVNDFHLDDNHKDKYLISNSKNKK